MSSPHLSAGLIYRGAPLPTALHPPWAGGAPGLGFPACPACDPLGTAFRLSISLSWLKVRGLNPRVARVGLRLETVPALMGKTSPQRPGELIAPQRVTLSSALCKEAAVAGGFWGRRGFLAGCGCSGGGRGLQFNPILPGGSVCLAGGCSCPSRAASARGIGVNIPAGCKPGETIFWRRAPRVH